MRTSPINIEIISARAFLDSPLVILKIYHALQKLLESQVNTSSDGTTTNATILDDHLQAATEIALLTDYGNVKNAQAAWQEFGEQLPAVLESLFLATFVLYLAILAFVRRRRQLFIFLSFLSIGAFWASPILAPTSCIFLKSLQYFAISVGTMRALDILARRNRFPTYAFSKRPLDPLFALIILTELRYESFTPNQVRLPSKLDNLTESQELLIHTLAFAILQCLPQVLPIQALEVLLAIYVILTTLQLVLRYKSSPPLFGPLYRAESLAGFWAETWHNVFAAPCTSLANRPTCNFMIRLNAPLLLARAAGVLASFVLMGAFHAFALSPLLPNWALFRIGIFFVINGIMTVAEVAVWGKKKHRARTVLAWAAEIAVASWAVAAIPLPNSVMEINWARLCEYRP